MTPIQETYIGQFLLEEYSFDSINYTYANGRRISETYSEAKEKLIKGEELNFIV